MTLASLAAMSVMHGVMAVVIEDVAAALTILKKVLVVEVAVEVGGSAVHPGAEAGAEAETAGIATVGIATVAAEVAAEIAAGAEAEIVDKSDKEDKNDVCKSSICSDIGARLTNSEDIDYFLIVNAEC